MRAGWSPAWTPTKSASARRATAAMYAMEMRAALRFGTTVKDMFSLA
jgi:hypothetical protein